MPRRRTMSVERRGAWSRRTYLPGAGGVVAAAVWLRRSGLHTRRCGSLKCTPLLSTLLLKQTSNGRTMRPFEGCGI